MTRGHRVRLVREEMADDTPDPLVADFAVRNALILVTFDRDFNQQRYQKPRYDGLMRLGFAVPEPWALGRLEAQIDRLERELAALQRGERFTFVIGRDRVYIHC